MTLTFPKGSVALITGGTGSIGQALVRYFAKAGVAVIFQYRVDSPLSQALMKECGASGVRVDFDKEPFPDIGRVDIIVNNAGVNISKLPIDLTSDQEWEETMRINLTVPMSLARSFLNQMKLRRWGRIINISSIYGFRVASNNLSYNVSKHAVRGLTASLAKEAGPWGITCNEICPGPVSSALLRRIAEENREKTGLPVDKYEEQLALRIPVGRLAMPEDVAAAAVWLASAEASYVNGVSLPVDGGMTV